jgi:sulfite exporter TauE/SafE
MALTFDLGVAAALGAVSSVHCAQMCGPIVLAYSMASKGARYGGAASHLFYNAGRIATYCLLGALAGTVGHAMGLMGRLAGMEQAAAIASGSLMVLAGLLMSGLAPRKALVQLERSGLPSLFSRTVGKLIVSGAAGSKFALGALMGFLPCGLLYAGLLKAASTADAVAGAASMAAFGAGTSGTLLAIGLLSSAVGFRLGRWSNTAAAAGVMAVGAVLVWRGLMAPAPGMSCHAGM